MIGDPIYGQGFKTKMLNLLEPVRSRLAGFKRQALHAAELAFVHPTTGTLLTFNSPLPDGFAKLVEAFKEL